MIAVILAVLGAAITLAFPPPSVVLSQPEFFGARTNGVGKGSEVVQTFSASGTVNGATVVYSDFDHGGTARHVTCSLLEFEGDPSSGTAKILAHDTEPVVRAFVTRPLAFSFEPIHLDPLKRYAIRIESDDGPRQLVLLLDDRPAKASRALYQGDVPLGGQLVFRIDGRPSARALYRTMSRGSVRPMAGPVVVFGLLGALLAMAGLIIGEAHETVTGSQKSGPDDRPAL